ncbi:hypothetical protein BDR07DRAFT_1389714 [Suillus spraguei]|nr:hypothetical protein BDR07DRAFT_1445086 [Suillus spraguei]KAG2369138.1 hypothetical protein BDR07DRAFT_1389714 [Suillus spraguei]
MDSGTYLVCFFGALDGIYSYYTHHHHSCSISQRNFVYMLHHVFAVIRVVFMLFRAMQFPLLNTSQCVSVLQ